MAWLLGQNQQHFDRSGVPDRAGALEQAKASEVKSMTRWLRPFMMEASRGGEMEDTRLRRQARERKASTSYETTGGGDWPDVDQSAGQGDGWE